MKKSKPIRMCITCRSKHPRNTLIRLKQEDTKIVVSDGIGRSFYLCHTCCMNEKKMRGLAKRFKQESEQFVTFLSTLRA